MLVLQTIWNNFKSFIVNYALLVKYFFSPLYITYLAGPMEYTSDNGLDWRIEYCDDLKKIGIRCVIPNLEEAEIIPSVKAFEQTKTDDLPTYIKTMRKIIDKDLKFVETVDFIIAHWEGEKMSGTIGEIQHAYLINTPSYLVTSKSFEEVPGWFLACFTKLFHTKKELLEFLESEYN